MYKITNTLIAVALGCSIFASLQQLSYPGEVGKNLSGASAVATPVALPTTEHPHWDYGSAAGPDKWGLLDKEWATCAAGKAQSPIDISNASSSKLPEIVTRFRPAELKIIHNGYITDAINNGHTIQINQSGGDTLSIGDEQYSLIQYHFHGPSEHTVDGKRFPMEMHMVHRSAAGRLAVIGVLIKQGKHRNNAFGPVWSNIPKAKGQEVHVANVRVDIDQLLPTLRTTFRYDGSLTTPPCSENVKWIVFANPIEVSSEQIGRFKEMMGPNDRPIQPLNGRVIATDVLVN